jgi:hypothetical protein
LWYLLVATHTDQKHALTAVDGWAGDAMTVLRTRRRALQRHALRGDTEKDSAEMYDSMKDVAAKLFIGHKPSGSRSTAQRRS